MRELKILSLCLVTFGIWLSEGCDCNLDVIKASENLTNIIMGKRQLTENMEEERFGEVGPENEEKTTGITSYIEILNDTHFKYSERELLRTIKLKEVCPFYKDIPALDHDKMADVWEVAYYKASQRLACFKIHIKKTAEQSIQQLKKKYGNFNMTVDWKKCHLELTPEGGTKERTRHFLQGTNNDSGILENIILTEKMLKNTTTITLQDQSPDQWLVTKNLLLMRDCDNGDVVVFSRVPTQPGRRDVDEALRRFGEKGLIDMPACRETGDDEVPQISREEILS